MTMQSNIDTVVHYLFQREELSHVPVETLRQFVTEHPYSAAGRYLLTRKLKDENDADYEQEIETSVLYYNNPLWLQFMLDSHPVQRASDINGSLQNEAESPVAESTTPPSPIGSADATSAGADHDLFPSDKAAGNAGSQADNPAAATHEDRSGGQPELPEDPASVARATEEENAKELAFEPYHTIDYFASQGIKLRMEDLDKDKFGKQLKSFTEWLKSMKRINPAAQPSEKAEMVDPNVQILAVHSLEGREAETEAMAEVWIKQGNKQKAIAIYQQLSLQNPSKSHYFAAKIEQLKSR